MGCLIMINEGKKFSDIIKHVHEKIDKSEIFDDMIEIIDITNQQINIAPTRTITDKNKVLSYTKYKCLSSFLDCIEFLNKDYIHTDLKNQNIVYKINNEKDFKLEATLIDLDDIIKKENMCTNSTGDCILRLLFSDIVVPIERIHYDFLNIIIIIQEHWLKIFLRQI